ncbi:MAG: TonB-dependent receptor domain-containing protein [Gemmatimonadaceae bacterium]
MRLLALALVGAAALPAPRAAVTQPAQPATGTVRGTIVDSATAAAVPRASVFVIGSGARAIADDSGRYVLAGLPNGAVELAARALGFAETRARVVVTAGATVQRDFRLARSAFQLAPVRTLARDERSRIESAPEVGTLAFARPTLAGVPAVGEPDVLRLVQLMPGVTARSDFTAGYNVRGGESDQNLVLLDGIPVYNPFHLGGLFGTFLDETVAEVTLLPGGFGASYGGRLSSVLDVTTMDETRRGVHGSASVSLLASSAALGGLLPDDRTSWGVAVRRTYADALARAVSDRTLPYHFQDAQLRMRRELGGGTLALTAYAGGDVLDGALGALSDSTRGSTGDFVFDWGNHLAGLTWRRERPGGPSLTQSASVTRFATNLDVGDGALALENSAGEVRLAGSAAWRAGAHERRVGYELARHHTRYRVHSEQLGEDFFRLRQSPAAAALWGEDAWRAGERLTVRGGARLERVAGARWTGLSPRLSARYAATPDLALTLAAGRYAQWMHAVRNEDVPVRIFDFWIASDRWVPVSIADQLVAGGERWFGDAHLVRVESYWKRYDHLPEPNDADDPLVRGDEFQQVRGRSYGVDVLLRRLETGRLGGWVSYGWSVSRRDAGRGPYAPAQDRRHNLNAVASWRAARGWMLGARLGLGTGYPFTGIEGQLLRRTYDGTHNQWDTGIVTRPVEAVGGDRNSLRYPTWHRLDLSAARTWRVRRAAVTPSFQLVNAYNRRNVFIYTFDYTDSPPTRTSVSQFPLLPSVGVTVEW